MSYHITIPQSKQITTLMREGIRRLPQKKQTYPSSKSHEEPPQILKGAAIHSYLEITSITGNKKT